VAVHDQVVGAVVPEQPTLAQGYHGEGEERTGQRVHRAAQFRAHPVLRGRPRVGLGTEVDDLYGDLGGGVGVLPRPPVHQAETEPVRVDPGNGPAERPYKKILVHPAGNLQILGDIENSVVRRDLLGVPDAQLSGCQLPRYGLVWNRHGPSSREDECGWINRGFSGCRHPFQG
jgi:hypothetical protein